MLEPLAALLRGAVDANTSAMAVLVLVVVALYLLVVPTSRHGE